MNNLSSQIIYKQLLERHGRIRIPMIQRDYAQGRPAEKEVREEFLDALEGALKKPADDTSLPLNLDFIYGSVEGKDETRFLPLDGQQRLTTLFLLHWYLAWNDQQWDDFCQMFQANGHARFSYSVRPSSNEFFDELVAYQPVSRPGEVKLMSQLISDQPWYFRSWRLDPTIQSALAMLDAIHSRFSSSTGLYDRLVNEHAPAITFQLLDLDNFGLSDDLYIKMNGRGKPLTLFETFKARYEQELYKHFDDETFAIGTESFSASEFVARRMDTQWADLFWVYRDKKSNLYDDAVMNVFRALALITRNPESPAYVNDVSKLRSKGKAPSYSDFHERDWLDRGFTITLIRLFEAWSSNIGSLGTLLPDQQYFNEQQIFGKVAFGGGADLTFEEVVMFAAYSTFLCEHHFNLDVNAFQEWMRIIFNLTVNTSYDRPTDIQRSIAGILKLISDSGNILKYFASMEKPTSGFSQPQIDEERLKAKLILSHSAWRALIDQAEGHGYFKGQIGFILNFSGAIDKWKTTKVADWGDSDHISLQEQFENYLKKAELMFKAQGLANLDGYLWERALLCMGDYLMPSGRNLSFLVNSTTEQASWKRLLRGIGPNCPEARKLLKQLFDRLTVGTSISIKQQLETIIASTTGLVAWRQAFVLVPAAIMYCGQRAIRLNSPEQIYLLKKSQMNGAHVELFTYCLYQTLLANRDQSQPLRLNYYLDATGTDMEPHILMNLSQQCFKAAVRVYFDDAHFVIRIETKEFENHADILAKLFSFGFQRDPTWVSKTAIPKDIEKTLNTLSQTFLISLDNEVNNA
ncbi:uncharacterized protein DUF262 [Methylobacter tundripaludum]|uniref:Uncharacterized protein DUF262 n=1 Tax=Methylobacter tundripaludum TaxID=173365 RepID=A0A2S6HEK9_9GAMM|nr:DUF262 domain-containing protein [Methylobacter tundripaludum]PPK75915.1 uncharacterized protein DUF262 [Methylobacter tundripaludum]